MVLLEQYRMVLLEKHGVVLLKQPGMVLLRQHRMVLREQCGVVLLEQYGVVLPEHHGAAASGQDGSSCPAASQARHSKPRLAPLGNPPLLGEVSCRRVCFKSSREAELPGSKGLLLMLNQDTSDQFQLPQPQGEVFPDVQQESPTLQAGPLPLLRKCLEQRG